MPTGVPIQQIPNQAFSITLDGVLYDLKILTNNGVTSVSLSINGQDVLDNALAASAAPIIPAPYQEAGNFMFLTANQQLPYYEQFGLTQSLLYFTADELATFRTPVLDYSTPTPSSPMVPTMTVNSFNPAGGLPLRFAPQGYEAA